MERKHFKGLTEEERRQLKEKIFLQLNVEDQTKVRKVIRWKRIAAVAVAASLFAVVGLMVLKSFKEKANERQLVAQTSQGEIRQLMLADSSVVILNPSSRLYVSSGYLTGKRELFLEGNGFFKVKKMASDRSFIVHAGTQSVTVLGTQFNVNTRKGDLEVTLTSGSVKVTAEDQMTAPQIMKPGDKLSYKADIRRYYKTRIDTQLYSPWTDNEWRFRNTSLGEIASIISEYYNVSIQFNNPETKDLKMTAVFPVTNMETLLKVITETLPVTITNQQQRLIIQ